MFAVDNDAQKTDGIDSIDGDRTDTEVRVQLFDVCELRFGAEPDKLHLLDSAEVFEMCTSFQGARHKSPANSENI